MYRLELKPEKFVRFLLYLMVSTVLHNTICTGTVVTRFREYSFELSLVRFRVLDQFSADVRTIASPA
jgi:hypothetical protein